MLSDVRVRFAIRAAVAGGLAFLSSLPIGFDGTQGGVLAALVAAGYAVLGLLGPHEPSVGVKRPELDSDF